MSLLSKNTIQVCFNLQKSSVLKDIRRTQCKKLNITYIKYIKFFVTNLLQNYKNK